MAGDSAPSKAALPKPPAVVRLAGVLSSHVGDEQRLERLRCCLRSVVSQTAPLAVFFMVWSAPEALLPKVEAVLEEFSEQLAPVPVRCLRQTRRTSQFYDLRWLYQEHVSKESHGTWLLFTDDDDLWGPERVRLYYDVINAYARTPGVTGVGATHKVRPVSPKKVARTQEEVVKDLKSGKAIHCGGVHVEEEFFDFSCPAECLGTFFEMCNDETLLHPFCDLRFTRFIQEYYLGGKVMYFPTDKVNPWVYYYSTAYRRPEDQETYEQFAAQDQASTVVRRRPEDTEEAMVLCRATGAGLATEEEREEMADFVAGLRQNIEAVLIRHFPEEPMKIGEMKRIAVGQVPAGQFYALKLAEKLARQACERFGVALE